MRDMFVLELYYEKDSQQELAERVRTAHQNLVRRIAPHIQLEVRVVKAASLIRCTPTVHGRRYDVPNHLPTSPSHQSLLITSEDFGLPGLAGPGKGCLNESTLRKKLESGADPADITVHEWLHTLEGQCIRECRIPNPDTSELHERFRRPTGRDVDGDDTWHEWYRHVLRP